MTNIMERLNKLARVDINFDVSSLKESDALALKKLIEVSRLMDEIYLRQVYRKNPEIRDSLIHSKNPVDKLRLEYFMWNMGPWDRLDKDRPFIGNVKKLPGAEFYPTDMTKEEFESWIREHPEDRKSFTDYYTVIRRSGNKLVTVPYSVEYREFLVPAAKLLKEASELTENKSLKKFLLDRADAFLSNDYFQSEVDWINLNGNIEVTIGPYEVYEDALFGYKAAFESHIAVKDQEESEKLKIYTKRLKKIDDSLPINKKFKFTRKVQISPMSVAKEIFAGGYANSGYRAQAFNLPNDERVRELHGSKKVFLKNIMELKFNEIVKPMSEIIIHEDQLGYVNFDSHFNIVLFHELSHGMGPSQIILDNDLKIPVSEKLKDLYSPLEEAKADILGLYCAQYFMKNKIIPKNEKGIYTTYLANLFRTFRFGLKEAHGKSGIIEYNYLKKENCISYDKSSEKFKVEYDKMEDGIPKLLEELLNIQAEGNYEKAQNFVNAYGEIPGEVNYSLKKLKNLKVDINPKFNIF
ncbi:MAG: peptidase [Candidatus Aenigmarchaeota archaeon]|nr:peptidase [Candidatus Aenigmarchaeota archaeon]